MQVNSFNKSQISFQGNLSEFCKRTGSAVGAKVKLTSQSSAYLNEIARNTNVQRTLGETVDVLKVFTEGAAVVGDEHVRYLHGERLITARNKEGKFASTNANNLNLTVASCFIARVNNLGRRVLNFLSR